MDVLTKALQDLPEELQVQNSPSPSSSGKTPYSAVTTICFSGEFPANQIRGRGCPNGNAPLAHCSTEGSTLECLLAGGTGGGTLPQCRALSGVGPNSDQLSGLP